MTKVAILAVPEALSRLGCLVRYWNKLPEAGSRGLPVRLTPRRVHDESYRGLREAARWVDDDEGEAVDAVVVVRRGNLVGYGNERVELDDGGRKWVKEPGALRALEIERARKLSEEEKRIVEEDLEVLRRVGDPKVDEEVEAIQTLVDGIGVGFLGIFSDLEPLDADEFVRSGLEER